jgi:hypothetical protein
VPETPDGPARPPEDRGDAWRWVRVSTELLPILVGQWSDPLQVCITHIDDVQIELTFRTPDV